MNIYIYKKKNEINYGNYCIGWLYTFLEKSDNYVTFTYISTVKAGDIYCHLCKVCTHTIGFIYIYIVDF